MVDASKRFDELDFAVFFCCAPIQAKNLRIFPKKHFPESEAERHRKSGGEVFPAAFDL